MKKSTNIGIPVELPKKKCNDVHCPFHAHWKVRGRIFTGTIVKKDTHHTVTIEWPRLYYLKKYLIKKLIK